MKFQIYLLIVCGVTAISAGRAGAEDSPPFSSQVLRSIPPDIAQTLYYSTKYLNSSMYGELSEPAREKAKKLESYIGRSVPVGRVPAGMAVGEYMNARRESLNQKFSDHSALLDALTEAAKAFSDPGGKVAAAHILDLVLTIDPARVTAAYEREKLFVTDHVSLNWEASVSVAGSSTRTPQMKGDLLRAIADGAYEVDFSKLGIQSRAVGATVAGLARNQSLIKGLLVQELTGSQFAGQASQMNATVLGSSESGGEMKVHFNQKVGPMMTDAVDQMMAFLKKRHGELPRGVEVELSFEEQYVPKDGPSAGVACTLLLDALLKGHEYSPDFVVTGAIDKNGVVGGVGGVDGKIRGAIARNCEIVAIPSENEQVIQDMLILEGPATLAKIQIIDIEKFDDALRVARKHENREESIKKAIETFREVQGVLNRPGGMSYLSNGNVQGKLRSVVTAIPNHLSAKYLLLKGMGREPSGLTLIGSVQAIDRNASPLIVALEEGNFNVQDRLGKDSFADTISALTRLRPMLDERTRPCADAIVTFSEYIRTAINSPPRSPSAISTLRGNLSSSGRAVSSEYKKLFDREDVKKDLMIEDDK